MSSEEIKDVQLRMGTGGVALMAELMTLPETFMWTKMGWESGVTLADILRQKEVERQAQRGLFRWGIGTTVTAERLRALRERVQVPHVVFTKMVSGSKSVDYEPETAMAWRQYVNPSTRPFPAGSQRLPGEAAGPRLKIRCRPLWETHFANAASAWAILVSRRAPPSQILSHGRRSEPKK